MLLDRHGVPGDRGSLLAYTTFNVAVGNADAHGKNISILHHRNGQAELAPMYDVSSIVHYRPFSTDLAMRVNRTRDINLVNAGDLIAEAAHWGLRAEFAEVVVTRTLEELRSCVSPASSGLAVDERLVGNIGDRVKNLLAGRAAGGKG